MRRSDVACVGVMGCGVLLAVAKARLSPIINDEAWSYNAWVRQGPGFFLNDYTHVTNHLLHTLLVWISTRLFGDSELALRIPALAGFALTLACIFVLSRVVMSSAPLRILLCAAISLHPYALDFAACSRGYSLAAGFTLLSLTLAVRALARWDERDLRDRHLTASLLLASASMGIAVGMVPIAATACVAIALSVLFFLSSRRWRSVAWAAILLGAPAAGIVALLYGRLIRSGFMEEKLWAGARSLSASLESVHHLLVYATEARIDKHGLPVIEWPIQSWHHGLLPDAVHQAAGHPLCVWLVALALIAAAFSSWLQREPRSLRSVTSNALLAALSMHLIAHLLLGLHLPEARMWLVILPILLVASMIAVDRALCERPTPARRLGTAAFLALGVLMLIVLADGISLRTHRDWPDNSVIPDAIETIRNARDPEGRTSVGFPWYQAPCFIYYKRRLGVPWLRVPPFQQSEEPVWDYQLVSSGMMRAHGERSYAHTRVVKSYPGYQIELRVSDGARSR